MNLVRNLNYANRKNPIWQHANQRANRYLNNLLLKEVLKMLPVMLLFKFRQHQKLVLCAVIALLFLLLFAHEKGYAQTDSTAYYKKLAYENKHYPRNNVQINLSSLALKNYNFSLERSLSKKVTFVAGYRYMPLSTISDISLVKTVVDKYLNDQDELKNDLSNLSTGNKTYTGEFRFYGGKHPGARGFYLSLYGRYTDMQVNYNYNFTAANNQKYLIPLKNNLKGFGGGLMLGSKWLIAKRVTFDWYVIGGHYGKLTGDGAGAMNLSSLSATDKSNLKSNLESDFTVSNQKYVTATVDNTGVTTKVDGPFIGLRGLGFSLGIAF